MEIANGKPEDGKSTDPDNSSVLPGSDATPAGGGTNEGGREGEPDTLRSDDDKNAHKQRDRSQVPEYKGEIEKVNDQPESEGQQKQA